MLTMIKYRPEIDGLRALAVMPVILYHAGFKLFNGGFVGVDIFFVISGYLITSIILAEIKTGTFSIINFYERRARRILPALFLVMIVSLPFSWVWLLDSLSFSKSLIAVTCFVSNMLFWLTGSGYFSSGTELNPLLHTWSLAVEEQYYVIFPLFLLLAWRLGKAWVVVLVALFALLSLGAAQWGSAKYPLANFYLLPTRGWEILIGALVAFYWSNNKINKHKHIVSELGSLLGLSLILLAIFCFSSSTPSPSLWTLIPTIGAALIIIFTTSRTLTGKLIGNKLMLGIGLVSYSAYLWHQPLYALARQQSSSEPSKNLMLVLTVGCFILAYLSWKFVERPFRNKHRFSRKQIFVYGGLFSSLFIGIGYIGVLTNGYEMRLPINQRGLIAYTTYQPKDIYREGTCFLKPEQTSNSFTQSCKPANGEDSLLIWGDSHAAALSYGLRSTYPNIIQYNASACPPIKDINLAMRPNCRATNDFVLSELRHQVPKRVFIHANWSSYKDQVTLLNLNKTIEYIKSINPNIKITIIGPVPLWSPSLPIYMLKKEIGLDKIVYMANSSVKNQRIWDGLLSKAAKENNVQFISILDIMCEGEECLATTTYQDKITPTAWDYGHLTAGGSVFVADKIKKLFN